MGPAPIGAGRGRGAGGASARRGDAGAQSGLGARSRAARGGQCEPQPHDRAPGRAGPGGRAGGAGHPRGRTARSGLQARGPSRARRLGGWIGGRLRWQAGGGAGQRSAGARNRRPPGDRRPHRGLAARRAEGQTAGAEGDHQLVRRAAEHQRHNRRLAAQGEGLRLPQVHRRYVLRAADPGHQPAANQGDRTHEQGTRPAVRFRSTPMGSSAFCSSSKAWCAATRAAGWPTRRRRRRRSTPATCFAT